MKKLFICASNIDRQHVFPVVEALEADGFSCCLPGRDYDFGPDWVESLNDAVYTSEMALFFDSDSARKSFRIKKELDVIRESGRLRIDFAAAAVSTEQVVSTVRGKLPEAGRILRRTAGPVPYKGNAPYVFVSYAHKNIDSVFPLLRILQQAGYRIWFDEGIDPGTEWAENIAGHLGSASALIACLSPEYLKSTNCCDELFYARTQNLPILLIFLQPMKLEDGNEMLYRRYASVDSDFLSDEKRFLEAVEQAGVLLICRDPEEGGS